MTEHDMQEMKEILGSILDEIDKRFRGLEDRLEYLESRIRTFESEKIWKDSTQMPYTYPNTPTYPPGVYIRDNTGGSPISPWTTNTIEVTFEKR